MPARSNEFQRLIFAIQSHLEPGSQVEESCMLQDVVTKSEREVDIVIRGKCAGHPLTISIECRDHKRKQDVHWVERMHSVHSRLPTNLLVLVSHTAYSAEALKIADHYGISCIVFTDIDTAAADRLFPGVESLWGKRWEVTVDRVVATLEPEQGSHLKQIMLAPDNALLFDDGTVYSVAKILALKIIQLPPLVEEINRSVMPEHKLVEFGCGCPDINGRRLHLQRLEPPKLVPIDFVQVLAKCAVAVDEFPLRHGKYGNTKIAWGKSTIQGQEAIVVATADENNLIKVSMKVSDPSRPKARRKTVKKRRGKPRKK